VTINFRVATLPVSQPRARATAINGKARMYEAKKSHPIHTFKAAIQQAAYEAYKGAPLEGPLSATLTFVFASKKKHRIYKTTKPDCDNLAKGLLDSLNGLLYVDDNQIVSLTVTKWHAAAHEQPHVLVTINEVST